MIARFCRCRQRLLLQKNWTKMEPRLLDCAASSPPLPHSPPPDIFWPVPDVSHVILPGCAFAPIFDDPFHYDHHIPQLCPQSAALQPPPIPQPS